MAYYALNETSGTVAREARYGIEPIDRTASLIGGPTLGVASLIGTGYAIETTSSSYISIPKPADDLGSQISIAFWFAYVSGTHPIMRDNRSTGGWYFDLSGTNPVVSVEGVAHTVTSVTSASLKDGARHYFVVTVDGGTFNHIYFDGVEVDTFNSGFPTGGDLAYTIFLGKNGANSDYSPTVFAGFGIYGSILSPSEVAANFAAADNHVAGVAPITTTALPVALGHPGMAAVTVEALPIAVTEPVLTYSSLFLSSATTTDVTEPLDTPDPKVTPVHIVSMSVPVPTLVDGRPQ